MDRARIGSLLGLFCSCLFAVSLVVVVNPYPPWRTHFLWALCAVLIASSVGVWFRKRGARLALMVAGIIYLVQYVAAVAVAPGACAGEWVQCYRRGVLSEGMFAIIYYFARLVCSTESVHCYTTFMYLLPAPMIIALVTLLRPLASNNRSKGRDA
jgi:hypothetical protein